jgi:hypothetical protein
MSLPNTAGYRFAVCTVVTAALAFPGKSITARLGRHLDIAHCTRRLWNCKAVLAEALNVEFDRFLNLPLNFFPS